MISIKAFTHLPVTLRDQLRNLGILIMCDPRDWHCRPAAL
jgi:hypothetical protein